MTSVRAEEQLSLLREAIDGAILEPARARTLIDQAGSVVITELTLNDIGETDEMIPQFFDKWIQELWKKWIKHTILSILYVFNKSKYV